MWDEYHLVKRYVLWNLQKRFPGIDILLLKDAFDEAVERLLSESPSGVESNISIASVWLLKTAQNIVFDELNRRKKQEKYLKPPFDSVSNIDREYTISEEEEFVKKDFCDYILKNLRDFEKEIFYLHFFEDLDLIQISKKLNTNYETVKKRYQRAMERIRRENKIPPPPQKKKNK